MDKTSLLLTNYPSIYQTATFEQVGGTDSIDIVTGYDISGKVDSKALTNQIANDLILGLLSSQDINSIGNQDDILSGPSQGVPSQSVPSQSVPSQSVPSQGVPSQDKGLEIVCNSILKFCHQPKSLKEIAEYLGIKAFKRVKSIYLDHMMKQGVLVMTIPDKPTSRFQMYVATGKTNRTK